MKFEKTKKLLGIAVMFFLFGLMGNSTTALAEWSALGAGTDETVNSLVVAADGVLYAGGDFINAGGESCKICCQMEWVQWFNIGTDNFNSTVLRLAAAPGGTLYAGGNFQIYKILPGPQLQWINYIAKWNGASWDGLGSGLNPGTNGPVTALAVAPDGTLYAGGSFSVAGGVSANYIAKWDGSTWSPLGLGTNGMVWALAVGPDGNLYAGGEFTKAGGVDAKCIAIWNGSKWLALGSGMSDKSGYPYVHTLAVGADGTLYAGGYFSQAGGINANRIAKWNGSSWSALGSGMSGPGAAVAALAVTQNGNLYAGVTSLRQVGSAQTILPNGMAPHGPPWDRD